MGQSFDAAIAAFEPPLPLAIALSGGADSTALLVACARRWPGSVVAIHVNHGLQEAAVQFEQRCTDLCAELGVPLQVLRVDARHARGESPEDAARVARYESLHRAVISDEWSQPLRSLALAQHADDQVESVLLALSRGAGIAGLAGMRPFWVREGIGYYRPLLQVAARDVRAWLWEQGVAWVEDPSNANEQFTRNRIRARVLPALADAFPHYRETFARSARHAAQAQALLEEIAVEDLALTGVPPSIAALRAFSRARLANLLRHWLRAVHGQQASAAQLEELLDQVEACSTRGHDIQVKAGTGFVRRREGQLTFTA